MDSRSDEKSAFRLMVNGCFRPIAAVQIQLTSVSWTFQMSIKVSCFQKPLQTAQLAYGC